MALGENAKQEIIVIKRGDDVEEKRKGGVWKIAHADFMTAMMAFFLIMWLVNATDDEIKRSIANYFNPLNLVQSPATRPGLEEPDPDAPSDAAGTSSGEATGSPTAGGQTPGDGTAGGGGNVDEGNQNMMASAGIRQETDAAAFHDPYAVLASAAADLDPEDPVAVDVPQSTLGETARTRLSDNPRDPFDPTYWQDESARVSMSLRPGSPTGDPAQSAPDATARRSTGPEDTPTGAETTLLATDEPDLEVVAETTADVTAMTNGSPTTSVGPQSALAAAILGQLDPASSDVLPVDADTVAQLAPQPVSDQINTDAAAGTDAEDDGPQGMSRSEQAAEAARALGEALEGVTAEVAVEAGEEAVTISLMDDDAFSMFDVGSASPTQRARNLFQTIGEVLRERDGQVVVRGHTDARPFTSGGSDNWVLSFARAHAAKRALVSAGVGDERMVRVEGLADRDLAVPEDPFADSNRRIEILYEPTGERP